MPLTNDELNQLDAMLLDGGVVELPSDKAVSSSISGEDGMILDKRDQSDVLPTEGPWEATYRWDNPKYGPRKTWVIHRTVCDPRDCSNFGDCDKPCYDWETVLAEDLESAGAPSDEVMEANARFIAAAPETAKQRDELLEALERIVSGMDAAYDRIEQAGLSNGRPGRPTEIDGGPMSQARAAIAKAKGEGQPNAVNK